MSRVKDQYHDDIAALSEPDDYNHAAEEYYAEQREREAKVMGNPLIEFEIDEQVEVSGTSCFNGKAGKVDEVKLTSYGYAYGVTFDEPIDMPEEINNGQPITGSVFFANELTEVPVCHT